MEDILTCHSTKGTGVIIQMNDDCIPFTCFDFGVLVLCLLARCQTATAYWDRAIVSGITNTCAFTTSHNIHCEKGLLVFFMIMFRKLKAHNSGLVQRPWSRLHTDSKHQTVCSMVAQRFVPKVGRLQNMLGLSLGLGKTWWRTSTPAKRICYY